MRDCELTWGRVDFGMSWPGDELTWGRVDLDARLWVDLRTSWLGDELTWMQDCKLTWGWVDLGTRWLGCETVSWPEDKLTFGRVDCYSVVACHFCFCVLSVTLLFVLNIFTFLWCVFCFLVSFGHQYQFHWSPGMYSCPKWHVMCLLQCKRLIRPTNRNLNTAC